MSFIAEIEELACGGSIYHFADNYEVLVHNDGHGAWDLLNAEGVYVCDDDELSPSNPYWQAVQTYLGA